MSSNDVDPFLLEVLKNGLDTIADEMALVLMKTAYSGIVRDSMDFSTAVCDAEGQTLAQGLTTAMHLGSFYDAMRCLITTQQGNIFPDDVFIFNDPYVAAGQHLPDIYIIKPIFYEERLVAWATTIAHHSDVGGIVPGSNALGATEIYQEGIRIPIVKFMERGKPVEPVWQLVALNVRLPDLLMGDLQAQMAACTACERNMTDLFRALWARNDDRLFRPPARLRRAAGARGDPRHSGRHLPTSPTISTGSARSRCRSCSRSR